MVSPAPGAISYVLSGVTLKSDGYLWAMKKDWTLTGYDDDTAYKTLQAATKACVASDTCKGVTKEEGSYRTNNHNMASQKKGRVAYILGDEYELYQSEFISEFACLFVCTFLCLFECMFASLREICMFDVVFQTTVLLNSN